MDELHGADVIAGERVALCKGKVDGELGDTIAGVIEGDPIENEEAGVDEGLAVKVCVEVTVIDESVPVYEGV